MTDRSLWGSVSFADRSRSPERRALNLCSGRARTSQACRAPSPVAMSTPQPSVLVTSSARPWNSGRPAASALRAQRQPPAAIAAIDTKKAAGEPAARQSHAAPKNRPIQNGPIEDCKAPPLEGNDQSPSSVAARRSSRTRKSCFALPARFLLSANQWASAHESRGPPPSGVPPPEPSWPIVDCCLPLTRLFHKAFW